MFNRGGSLKLLTPSLLLPSLELQQIVMNAKPSITTMIGSNDPTLELHKLKSSHLSMRRL
jgi:hypothetical protein